ncbi:hypothetical protein Tco_0815463 [Tanacetum coccineum]
MNRDAGYRSRDNTRRTVPVETSDALVVQDNALIMQDGLGYDWSYIAQYEPTEFALMAYTSGSDTEVQSCSKNCVKTYEKLQKQFDEQRQALSKANLEIIAYQLGLESIEAQLVVHQKNEAVYEEKIAVLEFEVKDKAEVRKNMVMYLKNQGGYKMNYFKGMKYEDIRPIFEKLWDQIQSFAPMDSKKEKGSEKKGSRKKSLARKRAGEKQSEESTKRQKIEDDIEKEELKAYLDLVPREEFTMEIESLDLVMSDSEHSTVSYTSISSDSDPSSWGILLMDVGELPEMDPYEEVALQGHATPPSPACVPDPIKLEHHVLVYVLEPVYPEYLVPSDDDIPVKDPEEEPEEEPDEVPEEDPEEDPIDYATDTNDNEDEEEESSEDDDDEEEEHLVPADPTAVATLTIDHVPSLEETEPFETDEFAATPPPPAYQLARLLASPTSPPSLLTPLSSPLPQIHSPPLPLPSSPTHTSPTYVEAPLGYRAAGIRMRAASPLPSPTPPPPLLLPSTTRRADIPEDDIPPQKRLLITSPTPRFEVGESSATTAARQRDTS